MSMVTVSGRVFGTLAVVVTFVACQQSADRAAIASRSQSGAQAPATDSPSTAATNASLLYGRVTTEDGVVREGRLRWGGDQEALWSNYFNGAKRGNPWVALAPKVRSGIRVLGKELVGWDRNADGSRPFMTRFGDIARIDLLGREIHVTLKSGAIVNIARFGADDMGDGVRVWTDTGRFTDFSEWVIRTIEFLPTPERVTAAPPMYGTVRTRAGEFTGLIQWDRKACLGADEIMGYSTDGILSLRFDTIRSIARRGGDSSLVTLLDSSTDIVLSGANAVAAAGILSMTRAMDGCSYHWTRSSALTSLQSAARQRTPISSRGARSQETLSLAAAAGFRGVWCSTLMKAKQPRRSMRRPRVWTT